MAVAAALLLLVSLPSGPSIRSVVRRTHSPPNNRVVQHSLQMYSALTLMCTSLCSTRYHVQHLQLSQPHRCIMVSVPLCMMHARHTHGLWHRQACHKLFLFCDSTFFVDGFSFANFRFQFSLFRFSLSSRSIFRHLLQYVGHPLILIPDRRAHVIKLILRRGHSGMASGPSPGCPMCLLPSQWDALHSSDLCFCCAGVITAR